MLTLGHVKRYIELGFIVHPCCPADHKCLSPGKIPFLPDEGRHMDGWQDHPQFSIGRWAEWVDYDSSINIGVLCGQPSGLLLIDIDNDGALHEYLRLHKGRKERPWEFRTGKGKRYLFRHRQGTVARSTKLLSRSGDYLEILGDGRQSVLPPSCHPSGRNYEWVSGNTPRDYRADEAPEWAASGEAVQGDVAAGGPNETNWQDLVGSPIKEGGRNNTLAKLCGHLLAPQPLPPPEVRLWMNAYNIAFCKPKLSDEELNHIINSITRREDASEAVIRKVMKEYDVFRDVAIEYLLQDPTLLDL